MRVQNNLQVEKTDRWDNQPRWIKRIIKIWIALELGWYAGWILHVINDLL
jgi:hypothetical protein